LSLGLVSVILPIYNVEKYLDQCIESVVNQTYKNLEIILVDDGSPDNCPAICDKWAALDSRIKVIHKQNEGLGMARNTGIQNATGEYICFFDSDDYIALDTIEKSYYRAVNDLADVVIFGFNSVNHNGEILSTFIPGVGSREYVGEEVLNDFFPDYIAPNPYKKEPRAFYMSACFSLYRLDVIKNSCWRFVSEREIISEDVYSLLSLFKYVNKISVVPEAFYFYRTNESSLSRKYIKDRYDKILDFYNKCLELCDDLGYGYEIRHRISKPFVAFTISALKQESVAPKPFKDRYNTVKNIINDSTFSTVLKQNKKDIVGTNRRILFFCARNKLYLVCYFLLKFRS